MKAFLVCLFVLISGALSITELRAQDFKPFPILRAVSNNRQARRLEAEARRFEAQTARDIALAQARAARGLAFAVPVPVYDRSEIVFFGNVPVYSDYSSSFRSFRSYSSCH